MCRVPRGVKKLVRLSWSSWMTSSSRRSRSKGYMREDETSMLYFLEEEENQCLKGKGGFQRQRSRINVHHAKLNLRAIEGHVICYLVIKQWHSNTWSPKGTRSESRVRGNACDLRCDVEVGLVFWLTEWLGLGDRDCKFVMSWHVIR